MLFTHLGMAFQNRGWDMDWVRSRYPDRRSPSCTLQVCRCTWSPADRRHVLIRRSDLATRSAEAHFDLPRREKIAPFSLCSRQSQECFTYRLGGFGGKETGSNLRKPPLHNKQQPKHRFERLALSANGTRPLAEMANHGPMDRKDHY